MDQPTILERAFALARSGECGGVSDVRRRLKEEQFSSIDAHLAGPSIKRQLTQICIQALEAKGEGANGAESAQRCSNGVAASPSEA